VKNRTGFDATTLTTSKSPARIRALGNGHCSWDSSGLIQNGTRSIPGFRPEERAADTYTKAMIARFGEKRAAHLLAKSGSHLFIFPNFIYVGAHYRLIQPVRPDETQVQLFPIMLKGVPDEINTRRLRSHELFYGPTGTGASDDLEIFARNQIGLSAQADPWILMSRGAHLEQHHSDGTISGQITDELSNRTIWQRWLQKMTGQPDAEEGDTDVRTAHAG
jgi:hypothetical protein